MTSAIDWDAALARLERPPGGELDAEARRRLLEERARELARVRDDTAPVATIELVVFTLGGERFAAEAELVVEAFPLSAVTPVPGVPPLLAGLVNHRGHVQGVFDLRRVLLERPAEDAPPLTHAVAVAVDGIRFVIGAEAVETTASFPAEGLAGTAAGLLRGVTAGLVSVLDLEALAADPRLHIDDD